MTLSLFDVHFDHDCIWIAESLLSFFFLTESSDVQRDGTIISDGQSVVESNDMEYVFNSPLLKKRKFEWSPTSSDTEYTSDEEDDVMIMCPLCHNYLSLTAICCCEFDHPIDHLL